MLLVVTLCVSLVITSNLKDDADLTEVLSTTQTSTTAANLETYSPDIDWWKAGIQEYNIYTVEENLSLSQDENTIIDIEVTTEMETTQTSTETESSVVETTTATTEVTTETTVETENQSNEQIVPRETFTVYDQNTGMNVTLEGLEMITQIVRNEVGAHYEYGTNYGELVFEEATVQAFTVAAYTYLKYCEKTGELPKVGLNTNISQALRDNVSLVYGEIAYYDDEIICAIYTAATGGSTLASVNSWGIDQPYLQSVESKYDYLSPEYTSTYTISADEFKTLIEGKTNLTLSENPENWITIVSTIDGGYVDKILIDGHSTISVYGKEKELTGTYLRNNIFSYALRSPEFTVEYVDGNFVFTMYGYGHGVGLSAYGANYYAMYDGWDYKQILQHYFTGVTIK